MARISLPLVTRACFGKRAPLGGRNPEGSPEDTPYRAYLDPMLTTSRRRPRFRRRFNAFRPAFVLIRARNPCLLIRFRLRGL